MLDWGIAHCVCRARPATLAWASAQIHCQCNVTEGRVAIHPPTQLTTAQVTTSGNDTAFVPFRGTIYKLCSFTQT